MWFKYYSSLGAEGYGRFSFPGRKPTREADRGCVFVKESGELSGTGNILIDTPPGMRRRGTISSWLCGTV